MTIKYYNYFLRLVRILIYVNVDSYCSQALAEKWSAYINYKTIILAHILKLTSSHATRYAIFCMNFIL